MKRDGIHSTLRTYVLHVRTAQKTKARPLPNGKYNYINRKCGMFYGFVGEGLSSVLAENNLVALVGERWLIRLIEENGLFYCLFFLAEQCNKMWNVYCRESSRWNYARSTAKIKVWVLEKLIAIWSTNAFRLVGPVLDPSLIMINFMMLHFRTISTDGRRSNYDSFFFTQLRKLSLDIWYFDLRLHIEQWGGVCRGLLCVIFIPEIHASKIL